MEIKLGVVSILMDGRLEAWKPGSLDEVIKRVRKDGKRMLYDLNPEALQHSEVRK